MHKPKLRNALPLYARNAWLVCGFALDVGGVAQAAVGDMDFFLKPQIAIPVGTAMIMVWTLLFYRALTSANRFLVDAINGSRSTALDTLRDAQKGADAMLDRGGFLDAKEIDEWIGTTRRRIIRHSVVLGFGAADFDAASEESVSHDVASTIERRRDFVLGRNRAGGTPGARASLDAEIKLRVRLDWLKLHAESYESDLAHDVSLVRYKEF